jgi:hypothetical protein
MVMNDQDMENLKAKFPLINFIESYLYPTTTQKVTQHMETPEGAIQVAEFVNEVAAGEDELALEYAMTLQPAIENKSTELFADAVTKTMKANTLKKEQDANVVIETSEKELEVAHSKKKAADELSRQEAEIVRKKQMAIFSAKMTLLGVTFMKMSRQTGIGGAKLVGSVAAGFEQMGKTFIAYGKHTLNIVTRSIEDAPKAFAKMQNVLTNEFKKALSSASTILEKAQKYLETDKLLKEALKEIQELKAVVTANEESHERFVKTVELREEGKRDEAKAVIRTETASEKRARENLEQENLAQAEKLKDALEKYNQDMEIVTRKISEDLSLKSKRHLEDQAITDSHKDVYSNKSEKYADVLRGKEKVVKGLQRSTSASDIENVEGPNVPRTQNKESSNSLRK